MSDETDCQSEPVDLNDLSEVSGIPLARLQEIKFTGGIPSGVEVLKLVQAVYGEEGEPFDELLRHCGLRD